MHQTFAPSLALTEGSQALYNTGEFVWLGPFLSSTLVQMQSGCEEIEKEPDVKGKKVHFLCC